MSDQTNTVETFDEKLRREAALIEQGRTQALADVVEVLGQARTGCREELGAEGKWEKCNQPAEFILWGKLIPPEALGPRCYDHAARHIGHWGLAPNSGWAVFDLRPFLRLLTSSGGGS